MKKLPKMIFYIFITLMTIWLLVTIYAQYTGKPDTIIIGEETSTGPSVLLIYNPDPFYDLDLQICTSFAEGFTSKNGFARLSTVNEIDQVTNEYDLYVFCANTYNYAPDWKISKVINSTINLIDKNVVALTLGAGNTEKAQAKLERQLENQMANILASEAYWLLRPNDEDRLEEDNVKVANEEVKALGMKISALLQEEVSLKN